MKKQEKGLLLLSTLLASLGGSLNALGIIIYSTPVSHFTGSVTNSSIAIITGDTALFTKVFSALFSFFAGNILSGYILEDKEFNPGKRYGGMLLLIGFLLMGDYFFVSKERVFLCILAFLCGIQNGLFITYRGMTVRMTHITGGLTDMGVHIGNYLRRKNNDMWKVKFYLTIISGFFIGGGTGTLIYTYIGRTAFVYISLGYIFSGLMYFAWRRRGLRTGTLFLHSFK